MGVQTVNLLWEFWSTAPVCIFLGKQEMLGLLCNLFFLMFVLMVIDGFLMCFAITHEVQYLTPQRPQLLALITTHCIPCAHTR